MRARFSTILVVVACIGSTPAWADAPQSGGTGSLLPVGPGYEDHGQQAARATQHGDVIVGEVDRPGPWIFLREQVAVAGWPGGLISDTRFQLRAPMYRSDSIVFQDTYAGVGAKLAVTPAFVEVGPRLSLAPIDVFDVDVQVSWIGYWPSSSGLLPYGDPGESTRDLDREDRFQDPALRAESSHAFMASAAPTIKLKIGPIIAFDAWTIAYYKIQQPEGIDSPYVYEAYWDRVIAWEDVVIEHQPALLGEILDGQGKPKLWVGATMRDRMTAVSKDRSIAVGGLIMFKPSVKEGWPTFVAQVLPYVKDPDRVGGPPSMALALVWGKDFALKDSLAGR